MRKWFLILLLFSLLSCQGSSYSASSVKLKGKAEWQKSGDEIRLEKQTLVFSAVLSKEGSYTLTLKSPSGNLEWSAPLTLEGGLYVSPELSSTRRYAAEKGEYTYSLINEDGMEINGKVNFDYSAEKPSESTIDGWGNEIILSVQPSF